MKTVKNKKSQPSKGWLPFSGDGRGKKKKTVTPGQKLHRKATKKWGKRLVAGSTVGLSLWENRREYSDIFTRIVSLVKDRLTKEN